MRLVAIGMFARDFIVRDNLVVEIRHVEATVGAELEIDGAEPIVLGLEKILEQLGGDAAVGIADYANGVDGATDRVCQEPNVAPLGGKALRGVV